MRVATQCIEGVGLCVIPKPQNDHRPLALRHRPLAFISGFMVALKIAAIGLVALVPTTAELSTITVNRIVQLTNAERKKAGLNELTVNSALTTAAQQKAAHMLEEDYFAHISPSGVTPWFWMNKAGYRYHIAGENLAIDFTEAEDVVAAWLASPTHRDNMLLPDYLETGVAVATGEFEGGTSTIVVHMFGRRPEVKASTTTSKPAVVSPSPLPASPTPTVAASPSPSAVPSVAPAPVEPPAPRPPRIAASDVSFMIAPATDTSTMAAKLVTTEHTTAFLNSTPIGGIAWTALAVPTGLLTLHAGDEVDTTTLTLAPHLATAPIETSFQAPAQVWRFSNYITGSITVTLFVLLSLAIMIRVRIQHVGLISHASFVLLLAAVLFFF